MHVFTNIWVNEIRVEFTKANIGYLHIS